MKSEFIKIQEPALGLALAVADATEFMPRDQEQSRRLHEPTHMLSSIDPITGRDIRNRTSHPHLEDGNLTVYFETDATHMAYVATPFNHPYARLPGAASADDDRGG
jgi:hypothetical protein